MKLKFKALVLVAMMSAGSAFAADYATDLTSTVDVAGDATTAYAAGQYAADPFTSVGAAANVALIQQDVVDGNIAVIDQSAAVAGNYAAISQLAAGGSAGIAYIAQGASNNNFAFIKQ